MSENPVDPYEVPDDPGTGSGVIPELDADEGPDTRRSEEPGDADTINVDEPHEDTETGGV